MIFFGGVEGVRWEEVPCIWVSQDPLVRIKSGFSKIFKDCNFLPHKFFITIVWVCLKREPDDQLGFVGNVVAFLLKTSPSESAEGHLLAGGARL